MIHLNSKQLSLRLIIGLVIILIQIDNYACYLGPDQYTIYEQWFYPNYEFFNESVLWNNIITGVYERNDTVLNPDTLTTLRKKFKTPNLQTNQVACYSNSKGSVLFVSQIDNEYKWLLRNRFPNDDDRWRIMWADSLNENLLIYDDEDEHIEIVGSIPKIYKAINKAQQRIYELQEHKKKMYPYFPNEYKIELVWLNAKITTHTCENIEGVYRMNSSFMVSEQRRQTLKDMWGYRTLGTVHTYINSDDSMLFITSTAGKKEYECALLNNEGYRKSVSISSSLITWDWERDGYQIIAYDNIVPIQKIAKNSIPNWAIYVMMILSVCCILTILAIIIQKCCVKDLNGEHKRIRNNFHIHPAFMGNNEFSEQQLRKRRQSQQTIAGNLE